jgi:uncharacterized protein YecT (DUF1311 family)
MRKTLITAFLVASGFTAFAHAASFDCAKASTAVEKLICADEKLSVLDDQLTTAYKTASETATDKSALKAQQKDWLKKKRNSCKDAECITKVYQTRIEELAKPIAPPKTTEPKQKRIVTTGYKLPLCNQYLALMERVPRNPENTCGLEYSFDEKAKTQGFSDIPWEEVDPKKYEDMLLKFWMYLGRDWTSEEGKKKKRDEFYNVILKNKLFLWHAVFDLNNDGKPDEVFKVISGDCMPGRGMFFIPSEKGFALKRADESIYTDENIFNYKGKTYKGNVWGIREVGGGDIYVSADLTVCGFKTVKSN